MVKYEYINATFSKAFNLTHNGIRYRNIVVDDYQNIEYRLIRIESFPEKVIHRPKPSLLGSVSDLSSASCHFSPVKLCTGLLHVTTMEHSMDSAYTQGTCLDLLSLGEIYILKPAMIHFTKVAISHHTHSFYQTVGLTSPIKRCSFPYFCIWRMQNDIIAKRV